MSIVDTEYITPADDGDVLDKDKKLDEEEVKSSNKENTTIFDPHKEGMTDCLAEPKRNNIRRISDELKIKTSGALESGKDGIKKAASGLSSGIKTVTNRIPMPKSPITFRRRSWHAYDELEEHICENDSVSDEGETQKSKRKMKKDKTKKIEDTKEKSPKSKKGRKSGKKSEAKNIDWCSASASGDEQENNDGEKEIENEIAVQNLKKKDKIKKKEDAKKEKSPKSKKGRKNGEKGEANNFDWCSVSGDELECKGSEKEVDNEIAAQNLKDEPPVVFDSLDTTDLMSKVTITVQEMD